MMTAFRQLAVDEYKWCFISCAVQMTDLSHRIFCCSLSPNYKDNVTLGFLSLSAYTLKFTLKIAEPFGRRAVREHRMEGYGKVVYF